MARKFAAGAPIGSPNYLKNSRGYCSTMTSALEIVEQYKGEVESELERHLPRTGEPKEFYSAVWELLDRGGKRFRPVFTFLACESVGGSRTDAVAAAASVELLHNMTLVHDDIEDDSELRRGKPCIHKIYGVPTAINVGDAMLIKVFEIANSSSIPQERCHRLVTQVARRAHDVTWGQAFEFSLWRQKEFTEDDVIQLLKYKTGALTRLAVEAGAIAGGGSEEQIQTLSEFGETVGIGFQIIDDVLNVEGDVSKYGKEIGGDIREGKKTVIAAHFLRVAKSPDKKAFQRLLGKKTITRSEVRKVIALYEKYASIKYAKSQAEAYLNKSKKALGKLPESDAKTRLGIVADFLVSRSY